ncbi:MAG: starch synthase, partial [Streptococcus orisratti]|nr:starch synthase [Streptococcus orisratti]
WLTTTLAFALDVYYHHKEDWRELQHNAMTKDFSWDTASLAYEHLYKGLK